MKSGLALAHSRLALVAAASLGFSACRSSHGDAPRSEPSTGANGSASASAAVEAPTSVRFVRAPAAIGEKWRGTRTSNLELSVEFWQDGEKLGATDSSRSEDYTRTMEVLGTVGGAPAKERVHYEHYKFDETKPEEPAHEDTVPDGKTYILDASEGKLVSTRADGKAVSPGEEETLAKLHGELGQDDPVVVALGTEPININKSAPLRKELFRALLSSDAGELKSGDVALTETHEEAGHSVAVLEWSAEMHSQEDNGLEITWHLKGKTTLGVSPARTLVSTVQGALDVSGRLKKHGEWVTLLGNGTMKDERHVEAVP